MTIKLGKSRFLAGCQCLRWLYLQVREPELAEESEAAAEAIIEQGRDVGYLPARCFRVALKFAARAGWTKRSVISHSQCNRRGGNLRAANSKKLCSVSPFLSKPCA